MGEWAYPNEFIAAFRLTNSQYAEDFLNEGSIKFNTPQSWIDDYKRNGPGRGDINEGTIAFCHKYDFEHIFELFQKYCPSNPLSRNIRPISTETDKSRLLLRDKRSLRLPCFCIYTVKCKLLPCPDVSGKHRLSGNIPASYFRDFAQNALPEDIAAMPLEKQPALIIISDYEEFKKRLYCTLKKIGLEENDILVGDVSYRDFNEHGINGWMDFCTTFPNELFIKNTSFESQSEARIVINTRQETIIQRLHNEPIKLGCMNDIASIRSTYFYDGIRIEATVKL